MKYILKRQALLGSIALSCAVVTPLLAQDPPTATETETKATQQQAELLKAQADLLTQRNALAAARAAPLQQFAGQGNTTVDNGGGAMESAYLAAVSLGDVAGLIDARVNGFLHPREGRETPPPAEPDEPTASPPGATAQPSPHDAANQHERGILVLSDAEALSFDRIAAFDAESEGIIHAYNRAFNQDAAPTCRVPAPRPDFMLAPAVIPAIGAILSVLQSDVHVQGVSDTPDDNMLIAALAAAAPGRYLQQGAIADPHTQEVDVVHARIAAIDFCEDRARHELLPDAHPSDERKELLQNLLKRSEAFHARLTTAGADGSVPLTAILRESLILNNASQYILRVHVNRSGGTLITRKDLLTALGFQRIELSGGIVATFRLLDRTTGRLSLGGTIVCRTGMTSLHSAISLRHDDIACADGSLPRRAAQVSDTRGYRSVLPPLNRGDDIFRRPGATGGGN